MKHPWLVAGLASVVVVAGAASVYWPHRERPVAVHVAQPENIITGKGTVSFDHATLNTTPDASANSAASETHFHAAPKPSGSETLPSGVYYRNKVVIVTFHDVTTATQSPWTMTPDQFDADLQALQDRHFNVITNAQFVQFMRHQAKVPDNAVLLTFDDGYQDMYTYALPELLKYHMNGTFFVIVGNADHNPLQHALPYMTWDQETTLHADGMALESHTYLSHYQVVGLNGHKWPVFDTPIQINGKWETQAQYMTRIRQDFLQAKTELENHFHAPVVQIAWPYGWGTASATRAAQSVGYQFIYTTSPGVVTQWTSPLDIPRIDIGYPTVSPDQAIQEILATAK